MKKFILLVLIGACTSMSTFAQRTLTLEECINIALDNNIDIKRARNNAISARADYQQSKFAFLPSLNAFASHRWNEGLDFDNTTGTLVNTTTLSGSGSISAQLNIFNGFQNILGLRRSQLAYEASEQTIRSNIQSTEASIVVSFLQVISTRENIKIQEQTLDLLKEQLVQQEKREAAGVGNMEQVYNFRSRVAAQNLTVVNLRNQLETNKLTLIQLLLLDPADDYDFEGITIQDNELEEEIVAYGEVYDKSVAFSPALRAAELNMEASKKSLKISQFAWMPSLTLDASYSTGWSSNFRKFDRDENGDLIYYRFDDDLGEFILDPVTGDRIVTTAGPGSSILDIGVQDWSVQFENNASKTATFRLSIPLFTRFQNRTQVQRSKIQYLNSELNLEQAKNTLGNQVQQAYLNLVNAKTSYVAARESLINLDNAFEFAKNRFESGTIDFVTYLVSLNGKNGGELELARAKYEILFRKLILNIFTGELNPGSN